MLSRLEKNWEGSPRRKNKGPSDKNWRWEKKLFISRKNESPEKILEKTIVQITDDTWVNQVPTASGLYSHKGDSHRNIDLAHQIKPGQFSFIELKVASDTPLKAAVEIIQYALFYIFSRLHYPSDMQNSKKLLMAESIHLRVLAPRPYYKDYNLAWMVPAFNAALVEFLREKNLHVQMDFDFLCFPSTFGLDDGDQELLSSLTDLSTVQWSW